MRAAFLFTATLGAILAGPALSAQTAPGAPTPVAPRRVGGELRFTAISAGAHHNCALTAEGRAYCWGRNNAGQLGDSSTTDRDTPVAVAGGLTFLQISAGAAHTCAVTTDDEPYCWGANQQGQLGSGGRVDTPYPLRVGGAGSRLAAHQITAGGRHSCATQKHWDKGYRAVCWGKNEEGQLGTIATDDTALPTEAFGVIRYVSITAGDLHTCGATDNGKVFCWGANERGQLGNGSITFSRAPFLTRMNRRVQFTQVVAGAFHTCALTSEREVYCWGENTAGQVGHGKGSSRVMFPALVRDTIGFTSLAAGGATTCALRPDGTAACWGSNQAGQYGMPASSGGRVPVAALPGTTWKVVSLGPAHGCGIGPDGAASCWGTLDP
jgi:alpha-tubulin suppressor-like RCC1 family protein